MAQSLLKPLNGDLQTLQSLLLPSAADPVFVAIGFERTQFIINGFQRGYQNTQAGLAILDTKCFGSPSQSKFATFNFITGDDVYFEESAQQYAWGTAERISVKKMLSRINACLCPYRQRNIVLVGHGFSSDLAVLQLLGLISETISMSRYWIRAYLDEICRWGILA
jgi:hypothetical protein